MVKKNTEEVSDQIGIRDKVKLGVVYARAARGGAHLRNIGP